MAEAARESDLQQLRALWEACFDDPPPFVDWFFENRFLPEYCSVSRHGGEVVACAHALPVFFGLRDALLPAHMVGGVATRPEFRRQGRMHDVMRRALRFARESGAAALLFRPDRLSDYASLGVLPASDTQYLTLPAAAPRPEASDARACGLWEAFSCYRDFARRYSAMVRRDWADFRMKMSEYFSSGGKILAVDRGGFAAGYCVYFEEETVYADECAALDGEAYQSLYRALARVAAGRDLTMRLPPDVQIDPLGGTREVRPRGALAPANIGLMIRAAGLSGPGLLRVTDPALSENEGVYDLRGQLRGGEPEFEISAGRLAQWCVGYKSMAELGQSGPLARHMDGAGKRMSYTIDEY